MKKGGNKVRDIPELGGGVKMGTIIIENVRGQWIVDETTTGVFQENVGYGDGALIELEIVDSKSLCCHPNNPAVCNHRESLATA